MVKRFDWDRYDGMYLDERGDWVDYDDYAALAARLAVEEAHGEKYQRELAELRAQLAECEAALAVREHEKRIAEQSARNSAARLAEAERLLRHVDETCACARVDIDAIAAFLGTADSAPEVHPCAATADEHCLLCGQPVRVASTVSEVPK